MESSQGVSDASRIGTLYEVYKTVGTKAAVPSLVIDASLNLVPDDDFYICRIWRQVLRTFGFHTSAPGVIAAHTKAAAFATKCQDETLLPKAQFVATVLRNMRYGKDPELEILAKINEFEEKLNSVHQGQDTSILRAHLNALKESYDDRRVGSDISLTLSVCTSYFEKYLPEPLAPLAALPRGPLDTIAKYLPPEAILALQQTNVRLHATMQNDKDLWKYSVPLLTRIARSAAEIPQILASKAKFLKAFSYSLSIEKSPYYSSALNIKLTSHQNVLYANSERNSHSTSSGKFYPLTGDAWPILQRLNHSIANVRVQDNNTIMTLGSTKRSANETTWEVRMWDRKSGEATHTFTPSAIYGTSYGLHEGVVYSAGCPDQDGKTFSLQAWNSSTSKLSHEWNGIQLPYEGIKHLHSYISNNRLILDIIHDGNRRCLHIYDMTEKTPPTPCIIKDLDDSNGCLVLNNNLLTLQTASHNFSFYDIQKGEHLKSVSGTGKQHESFAIVNGLLCTFSYVSYQEILLHVLDIEKGTWNKPKSLKLDDNEYHNKVDNVSYANGSIFFTLNSNDNYYKIFSLPLSI